MLDSRTKELEQPAANEPLAVSGILDLASNYLVARITASRSRSEIEHWKMRLDGARLQQHLTHFILDGYGPNSEESSRQSRRILRGQLAYFWQEYHRLVIEPIVKLGGDPKKISHELSWGYVLQLQKGVVGMVAAAVMAQNSGWEVFFPTPEEDAKRGIDLYVKKSGKPTPLQIKCQADTRFRVAFDQFNPEMIDVFVPSPETAPHFYLDSDLGIPHDSHGVDFDRAVNGLMRRKAA